MSTKGDYLPVDMTECRVFNCERKPEWQCAWTGGVSESVLMAWCTFHKETELDTKERISLYTDLERIRPLATEDDFWREFDE